MFDQAENRLWAQEALLALVYSSEGGNGRLAGIPAEANRSGTRG